MTSEGELKGGDAARRLIAVWGASTYMQSELERWNDDVVSASLFPSLSQSAADPALPCSLFQFFIQLYSTVSQDPILRRQAQPALDIPSPSESTNADLFSADIERYGRLAARSEEALVKLVTSEVEAGLRSHLTRCVIHVCSSRLHL